MAPHPFRPLTKFALTLSLGSLLGVAALEAQLRLDPAEAEARAAAADSPRADVPVGPLIMIGVIFFLIFVGTVGALARGGRGRPRRGSGVAPILIWAAAEALRSSSRGGGGGSSWGGGGGFSGGGGSFGGGGASGGW